MGWGSVSGAVACSPGASSSRCEWLDGVDTGSVMLDVDLGTLDVEVPFICPQHTSTISVCWQTPSLSFTLYGVVPKGLFTFLGFLFLCNAEV